MIVYCDIPLTEFPIEKLTDNTDQIMCANTSLKSLPILPRYIDVLKVWKNRLTTLPESFYSKRVKRSYLNDRMLQSPCMIGNQYFTMVQSSLPLRITIIDCSYNQITCLPDVLPELLSVLVCINNNLSVLPDLTDRVHLLCCSGNPLLDITYPLLHTFIIPGEIELYVDKKPIDFHTDGIKQLMYAKRAYINSVNQQRRQARYSALCTEIIEAYVSRKMHPKQLQRLIDGPTLDVDEFMIKLAETAEI